MCALVCAAVVLVLYVFDITHVQCVGSVLVLLNAVPFFSGRNLSPCGSLGHLLGQEHTVLLCTLPGMIQCCVYSIGRLLPYDCGVQPINNKKKHRAVNRPKAFSYGTFLRTENERFQFSKPIVSLMGSKMVHFRVKFFDFHFRDGLHSEMEPHFRSTS